MAPSTLFPAEPAPARRDRRWLVGRWLLAAVFLGAVAWVLWEGRAELGALRDASPGWLAALVAVSALNQVAIGYAHRALLVAYGISLRPLEWIGLAYVTAFGSLFLPVRGGLALRALYLKRARGLPLSLFAAASAFLFFAGLIALGATGAAVTAAYLAVRPAAAVAPVAVFAGLAAVGLAGVYSPGMLTRWAARRRWDAGWLAAWRRSSRPRILGAVVGSYVAMCLLFGLRLFLAFRGLGVRATPLDCAQAGVVLLAVTSVSLTPANLGFREVSLGAVMSYLGYPLEQALVAGLLDRAAQLAVLVPGGLAFGAALARRAGGGKP